MAKATPHHQRGEAARKPGSRSKGHRGYRPAEDEAAAPKRRWTAEDRAARADRGAGARGGRRDDAPARPGRAGSERDGDRSGRARSAVERPAWGDRRDRGERTAGGSRPFRDGDARGDRASRDGGRDRDSARAERPYRSGDHRDRPVRGARPASGHVGHPRHRDAGQRGHGGAGRGAQRERRVPIADRWDQPARDPRDYREFRPERAVELRAEPQWGSAATPAPTAGRPSGHDRPRRAAQFDRADRAPRPDRDRAPRMERTPRPEQREDVVLDRLQAEAITAEAAEGLSFADLGIGGNLVRALAELGATEPFPIQAATIPDVLAGRDVLGRGRTGSGKTIAFGAPLVERLLQLHRDANPGGARGRGMGRAPRALILAPTRELAQQIDRTVQQLARSVGLFTVSLVGGVPYHRQLTGLRRGVDIVIGTPGRIEDLAEQGELDLSEVAVSVVDEADHMCDLGFLEPVQRILRQTAPGGQRLLFSATLDTAITALIEEFLAEAAVHEVAGEDQASSTIEHRVLVIDPRRKREAILDLVGDQDRAIVFTRTRAFAEMLAEHLEDAGVATASLHGDLNQAKRNRNLALLTGGRVRVLVATDVAARGIHVDDVPLIIQADTPDEYKSYLHRSGRTGRAGASGTVVTLVGRRGLPRMQELLQRAEIVAEVSEAGPRPRPLHAD